MRSASGRPWAAPAPPSGVLVGGVLTAGPGWPWVFFVNVPVGVVILVVLTRVLPPLPAAGQRTRPDVLGAVLVTAATGCAIYALIGAGDEGWGSARTLGFLAAAAVLYVLFGLWQRTTSAPLMDLSLLLRRPVTSGTFVILVATALMVGVFFLGSFFLQHHEGHSALVTGLLFLPVALATMAGATTAGRMLGAVGARRIAVVGNAVATAGFVVPAVWDGTLRHGGRSVRRGRRDRDAVRRRLGHRARTGGARGVGPRVGHREHVP